MGSSKSTTTQQQTNTLPSWLTSPYQAAVSSAGTLAAQPAIGTDTQTALNGLKSGAAFANMTGTNAIGNLSGMASGNFSGTAGDALTSTANGSALAADPWATNGQAIKVSGALSSMAQNGGLNTGYIDQSGLNDTASGKYLTADSNPYIASVAQQGADAAQARINAQFGSAGRSNGSGLYAQLFGQGVSNATNSVYATNYANERQLQQSAQNSLLSANQTAQEAALQREYAAQGSIFGAENSANENAAQRAASAYANERGLQTSAAGNLLSGQLSASSQIPSILAAMTSANNSAANAGEYQDTAALNQQAKYAGILAQLSAPYGQSSGTSTTTQSQGLGSILGSIAGAGLSGLASNGFKFG